MLDTVAGATAVVVAGVFAALLLLALWREWGERRGRG